jgi:hypothetical protein
MDFIIQELTLIETLVYELQYPLPRLGSVLVLSFIDLTIRPLLNPISILLIFFPLSNVLGTILMCVGTLTTGFVIDPLPLIDVTISVV